MQAGRKATSPLSVPPITTPSTRPVRNVLASPSPRHAPLQSLDLRLQLFDNGMTALQILVQAIPLTDQLLLPLPKPLLLDLDLLGKPLPQRLFFLFELRVVQFPRPRLAKLPRLHLRGAVHFVVVFFRRVDQVEHVRADEDGAQFLEVAVVFIFDLGYAPGVLATFDCAAVGRGDVALRADDAEGHRLDEGAGVDEAGLVVFFEGWGVDFDALGFDYSPNLGGIGSVEHVNDAEEVEAYASLEFE